MTGPAPERPAAQTQAGPNAAGSRLPARPLLAVVAAEAQSDGIAYVGRLLRRALEEMYAEAVPVVALGRGGTAPVPRSAQARFAARLAWRQRPGGRGWVMFNHVSLARAQRLVPSPWRRPYAVFVHGIEAWERSLDDERRTALRDAAVRITNSRYTAARMASAHGDLGPFLACPLALLPRTVSGEGGVIDQDVLASVAPRSVAIVGRMSAAERYKGHDALLECWPRVLLAVPDAQLVVVGRGDDLARLREKAAALGVSNRVLFTGFVSDATLRGVLARATAFAMPSRGEGFGLVYLEAMHAGLPCIGSTADAAVDVIVDGETGYLVDPASGPALESAVVRLLTNEPLAAAMGQAARRRVEREFDFHRFRDQLRAIVEQSALGRG